MTPPNRQSVSQISAELGIHVASLYNWRKAWRLQGEVVPASEKEPEGWDSTDKFTVVLETAGLNATELSAYCRERGQANRRGRARPPQEPRPVPRLRAAGPNQVWSWDITYLPTTVRGVWLYLYLVIDVWSRKVVAWDVAEREDPAIAADLVSRACLPSGSARGARYP
ncbi:DDE-type integrase/transposase/recombinase [Cyanobium sp. Alchichica 3B3-8F6]|uniref:DDE-type integrase/transposase/recombinase n=2 Tax=Synechococcales TaxID=1890424 RepID=UPI0020CDEBC7|nr:DDE-type integrase/transposase/recombinase [Cyanobium sp. Alchichica 3B3-8F6]